MNSPLTKILPSVWTAIELTLGKLPVAFAIKRISQAGMASSRPMPLPRRSADVGELAACQNLAVRLERD